ncbi:hypothetical protein [Delftia acidovorans]|uniref:hypothetical protein n=1 Tax=Delftia acidovorans TaxID=80866 RepID=UPI00286F384C|nr:hypothetical protein [Delftia acidovorans]
MRMGRVLLLVSLAHFVAMAGYASEGETECKSATPKKITISRSKPTEPPVGEITVYCGSQTTTQTVSVGPKDKNPKDDLETSISWGKLLNAFFQLLTSFAWPLAAIWISYIFRAELRSLLGRMSTFKYKEMEAKFERDIAAAKAQSSRLEPSKTKIWNDATLSGVLTTYELFQRIAATSPRAAIIEYWIDLEAAISAAAKKAKIEGRSVTKRVAALIEAGHIEADAMPLFLKLRDIRNQATHLSEFSISVEDALAYLDSVLRLGNEFRHYAVDA